MGLPRRMAAGPPTVWEVLVPERVAPNRLDSCRDAVTRQHHVPFCVSKGTDQLLNRSWRADPFRPLSGTPDGQEFLRSVDHNYRRTNGEIADGGPPWVQLTFVLILWPLMMRIVSGVDWRESRSKT
jgi:hypothetical protein